MIHFTAEDRNGIKLDEFIVRAENVVMLQNESSAIGELMMTLPPHAARFAAVSAGKVKPEI